MWERAPLVHHERLGPLFQHTIGVVHDFVTRLGGEVRVESGVDKRHKGKILQERYGEVCQCVHWEMGMYWGGGERRFPIELHNVGS